MASGSAPAAPSISEGSLFMVTEARLTSEWFMEAALVASRSLSLRLEIGLARRGELSTGLCAGWTCSCADVNRMGGSAVVLAREEKMADGIE